MNKQYLIDLRPKHSEIKRNLILFFFISYHSAIDLILVEKMSRRSNFSWENVKMFFRKENMTSFVHLFTILFVLDSFENNHGFEFTLF